MLLTEYQDLEQRINGGWHHRCDPVSINITNSHLVALGSVLDLQRDEDVGRRREEGRREDG